MVAGASHTCMLNHGTVAVCFGYNQYGQLGNGYTTDALSIVSVTTNERFTSLSPGGGHTCGFTANREIYCWGANTDGQLGNLTTNQSLLPQRVILPVDEYGL